MYLHHIHSCPHKCGSSELAAVQRCHIVATFNRCSGTGGGSKMHEDWQLTGSEPSGIEYVQQHKHGHDFAVKSVQNKNGVTF